MLAGFRPVLGFSSAAGSAAQGFVLEDQLLAAEKTQGFNLCCEIVIGLPCFPQPGSDTSVRIDVLVLSDS